MIRQAALYLAAPEDLRSALLSVAGRPVAFRALLAAIRAGAGRVGIPAAFRATALERTIADSPTARAAAVWLDRPGALAEETTLLVPAAALAPARALTRLLAAPPGTALAESRQGGAPAMVADAPLLRTLGDGLATGAPLGDALDRALKGCEVRAVPGDAWYVRVRGRGSAGEAEARLYGDLGSPIDTALDVALHRRLSRPVSRLAVATSVTPNHLSLASLLVGLAAVWAFWGASAPSAAAGLALYVAAVVLDHADGEVARLTLAESALGEWLDIGVDTAVHALLVVAMGVTAERLAGSGSTLGLAAAVGVVASAAVSKAWPPVRRADALGNVLDGLASRDGFYAMLLLFIAALAVRPAALALLMVVVALGAHAYWLTRFLYALLTRLR